MENINSSEYYNDVLCELTDIYEDVNESNFLEFSKVASSQYKQLFHNRKSGWNDIVNWRVNFINLHEYVIEKNKSETEIIIFHIYYEESVEVLYRKLGIQY